MPFGYNPDGSFSRIIKKIANIHVFDMEICTMDISGWEIKPLPEKRHEARTQGGKGGGSDFRGIRPCIRALIEGAVPMRHTAGHGLRMAVATEYLNVRQHRRLPMEEIAKLFSTQTDYSFEESLYQVRSLEGYHPAKCDTIRGHASTLDRTIFDIDEICKQCKIRRR
jgi:hypothetical protein